MFIPMHFFRKHNRFFGITIKIFKPIGRFVFRYLPLDFLLNASRRLTYVLAKLLFVREWQLQSNGRPQFFKHSMNLASWPFDPSRWAFTARGVFARAAMNRGCRVLDVCCGDGTYSRFFFSDVAESVDAVDWDGYAIAYANRFNSAANVKFHQLDLVNQPFPSGGYDVVVWNAAICYFTELEIGSIIHKIIAASTADGLLIGMCPKANGWQDHKTEFTDAKSLADFLGKFYKYLTVQQIDEGNAISFYFQASQPFEKVKETK